MADYICIKDCNYGARDYKVGDIMKIKDELIPIARQDPGITNNFKIKPSDAEAAKKAAAEKAKEMEEKNPQRPMAMSEFKGGPLSDPNATAEMIRQKALDAKNEVNEEKDTGNNGTSEGEAVNNTPSEEEKVDKILDESKKK
jgi:hypothetical protein